MEESILTFDWVLSKKKTDKKETIIEVNNRYMQRTDKNSPNSREKHVGNGGSPQICSGREFISLDLSQFRAQGNKM